MIVNKIFTFQGNLKPKTTFDLQIKIEIMEGGVDNREVFRTKFAELKGDSQAKSKRPKRCYWKTNEQDRARD